MFNLQQGSNWRIHFKTGPTSQSPAICGAEWSTGSPSPFNAWERVPHYRQNSRVCGPQSWSGRIGEEQTLCLAENRTSNPQAHTVLSTLLVWSLLPLYMQDDTELPFRWQWTCENGPALFQYLYLYSHRPMVPNVWSRNANWCTTSSQEIRGYIYLTATL